MIPTVLELSSEGQTVKVDRGFYVVSNHDGEAGRVPVENVGVLLLSGSGGFISKPVLARLMEQGGTAVVCGTRFTPVGIMAPFVENGETAARAKVQIAATAPLKKRLWQTIVQAKLANQAAALDFFGNAGKAKEIRTIASGVRSGDPENREAWGARVYWPSLFGEEFRRSDDDNNINGLLNYGYAILRACATRALCASGLLPMFGLMHGSSRNPFALADDIMEPFRPLVDSMVKHLVEAEIKEVSTGAKRALVGVLGIDVETRRGKSPVSDSLLDLSQSLLDSFRKKANLLCVPDITMPDETIARSLAQPT
jgi:CRISPR-associated protein Cas1